MLPGVISGHYRPEQAHIDLKQLSGSAGCEFIEASVKSIDAESQTIITNDDERIPYDLLSINTGSTQSNLIDANHCISIKPVDTFLRWLHDALPERLHKAQSELNLVVVGAGAAGVETALALKQRFQNQDINIHLVSSSGILNGFPPAIQRMMINELTSKGIRLHQNFRVASVNHSLLVSDDNKTLSYHQLILATSASPAPWLSSSKLTTDDRGFIVVNSHLQSVSHPNVFAVGDVASAGLAKCGVYAVRQAPTLHSNLANTLNNKPLHTFHPQQQFLSLLNCADGSAIASRGWFRAKGRFIWNWKDLLDRQFMSQFPLPSTDFISQK